MQFSFIAFLVSSGFRTWDQVPSTTVLSFISFQDQHYYWSKVVLFTHFMMTIFYFFTDLILFGTKLVRILLTKCVRTIWGLALGGRLLSMKSYTIVIKIIFLVNYTCRKFKSTFSKDFECILWKAFITYLLHYRLCMLDLGKQPPWFQFFKGTEAKLVLSKRMLVL